MKRANVRRAVPRNFPVQIRPRDATETAAVSMLLPDINKGKSAWWKNLAAALSASRNVPRFAAPPCGLI